MYIYALEECVAAPEASLFLADPKPETREHESLGVWGAEGCAGDVNTFETGRADAKAIGAEPPNGATGTHPEPVDENARRVPADTHADAVDHDA